MHETSPYFFLIFIPAHLGFIALIIFVLSRLGYQSLAKQYRYYHKFIGKRIGIISAKIGYVNYNNAFILYYNEEGIYLKPIILIRLFHAPIFIPKSDLHDFQTKELWTFKMVKMEVGNPAITSIMIKEKTFRKIGLDLK